MPKNAEFSVKTEAEMLALGERLGRALRGEQNQSRRDFSETAAEKRTETIFSAASRSYDESERADPVTTGVGDASAEKFVSSVSHPTVFELLGDVGAGKTTFTRGLARGLGTKEPVTSPSFTISKQYAFPESPNFPTGGRLIHYDFYRLPDPGLMRDDLAEALADPLGIVVIEWGQDVANLFPKDHIAIKIALQDDGSRLVQFSSTN